MSSKATTPPSSGETPQASVQAEATSAVSAFFVKLKQQSFTVMLMVGIVYYQHAAWQADKADFERFLKEKDARIMELVDRERERLMDRERYLREQRDQFVELLKEQAAWNRNLQRSEKVNGN